MPNNLSKSVSMIILNDLSVSTFSSNLHICVNYSLKQSIDRLTGNSFYTNILLQQLIIIVVIIIIIITILFNNLK